MPISEKNGHRRDHQPPMEGGSRLEPPEGEGEGEKEERMKKDRVAKRIIEPFVPNNTDFNPRELKSWAKRTGFNPNNFSGETVVSSSSSSSVVVERRDLNKRSESAAAAAAAAASSASGLDLEIGLGGGVGGDGWSTSAAKIEIEPILSRRRNGVENRAVEIDPPVPGPGNGLRRAKDRDGAEGFLGGTKRGEKEKRRIGVEPIVGLEDEGKGVGGEPSLSNKNDVLSGNGNGNGNENENGVPMVAPATTEEETKKEDEKTERDVEIDMFLENEVIEDPFPMRQGGLKCGVTENPGFPSLIFYGLQHYLSLAGSLVFIPLIIVPAMGGTDEDTATVISTMLLVSGVTTILNSYFGTRLPLVQGSSFVYLAPALVVINSEEFRNLSENKFKHIMRELQGAIIIGSLFQTILGYSGLMSLLLRLVNPVVVAPTVAAVGLTYFSYGFPQAGTCIEISIPQIFLILVFTLYLRKVSIFGHRVFLVYAVPLSVAIVWAYAFFLTAGGAYNYKDCRANIPSSNILLDNCRKHASTMKSCRTDVSNAWRNVAWVRVPYPLQWGTPTFHFRTSIIMIFVSLVASVDSVGSYHATSLLVNLQPPTSGIVSRGIGLEGCSSILAGLWGTGTGSTTLTENMHTIDATKMASRRAVELGAAFLIFFSLVGKVGALLASIPLALAASVLCFTWALIMALGLSTLQYTQTASSRNMMIVGFSLFISLSIPAYFQQYQPITSLILPSYFLPYAAASNGPVHFSSKALNYALNAVLSLNMVVALFAAFVLDNTVPGSRQERGVYIWSASNSDEVDPSLSDYSLPEKVGRFFRWVKWIGS